MRVLRGATLLPSKGRAVIKIKIKLNIMPFVRSLAGLHLVIWVSNSVKLAAELLTRKSCAKREGADWLKYVKVVNF